MAMMVPPTRVEPTKIAVQLEFAHNPVCSHGTLSQTTCMDDAEDKHGGLQNKLHNLLLACAVAAVTRLSSMLRLSVAISHARNMDPVEAQSW